MPPLINRPLPAPAKLNLMLHVTGRRMDGYHLLQTVFQFVDLADQLLIRPTDNGQLSLSGDLSGLPVGDNLVYRAARLLQNHTGTHQGAEITLEKHIPAGGGLGGGSSDAATTLAALNKIWNTGLSTRQLMRLGTRLGADVPVFLFGRAAWGEGIGEQLTALELDEPWYLILLPENLPVPTGKIFAHPKLTRNRAPIRISDFFNGAGHNDCYPIVASLYPQIAWIKDWLQSHADARLSGTGASVFASFPDPSSAREVLRQVPAGYTGFVTRAVNRHPLRGIL